MLLNFVPVYLLDSIANLPILSYDGRLVENSKSIEKFCKKCRKKFYIDTKKDFFKNLDKYGIKEVQTAGIFKRLCASCSIEIVLANHRLTDYTK